MKGAHHQKSMLPRMWIESIIQSTSVVTCSHIYLTSYEKHRKLGWEVLMRLSHQNIPESRISPAKREVLMLLSHQNIPEYYYYVHRWGTHLLSSTTRKLNKLSDSKQNVRHLEKGWAKIYCFYNCYTKNVYLNQVLTNCCIFCINRMNVCNNL